MNTETISADMAKVKEAGRALDAAIRRRGQVLHKLSEAGLAMIRSLQKKNRRLTDEEVRAGLAVGKVFRFDGSKTAYMVTASGAVRRVEPKPWNSKAGRKRYLKQRRRQREEEAHDEGK